jgi:Domain of unknown function (DUF1906)
VTRGLDYAWTRVPPQAARAAGFGFIARYLSHDPSKNLTGPEAAAIVAANLEIVVVWEDTAQGALRGHAGGVADALAADSQARACGLPGAFIYFAADWDTLPGQQSLISAYLDGCATVIGRARTGLYGGYWACSRAREMGRASKFWGTVAWSGSNWATCGWVPDVMQGAQVTVDGVSVDLDTGGATGADFGQWPRAMGPAAPVPSGSLPEGPDMIILNVDTRTVPKGTPWPGIFLVSGPGQVTHLPDMATVAAWQALGVPEKVRPYSDWLLLGGKPVSA